MAAPPATEKTAASGKLWDEAVAQARRNENWQSFFEITGQSHLVRSRSSLPCSSPEDILRAVADVQSNIEESQTRFQLGGKTVLVREMCKTAIEAAAAIGNSGATVMSLNPYASLAWTGLQFFVQTLATAQEARELCWLVLPRATYLITRYQTLEQLYSGDRTPQPDRELLDQTLVELYTLILEYQMAMVIYLSSRRHRIKTSFGAASDSPVQKIWGMIKEKESTLSEMQAMRDRQINDDLFQQVIDASAKLNDTLDQAWDEIQNISQFVEGKQRREILDWVSDVKYENLHNDERRAAMAQTGQWLLDHKDYKDWRSIPESSALWLNGFMGSGKSCLSHAVIDDLKNSNNTQLGQRVAYFYIDGTDARGARDYATKIMRCLLKQLADVGASGKLLKAVTRAYEEHAGKGDLTNKQSAELIQEILRGNSTTYLVVDGLDECNEHSQSVLIKCLFQLSSNRTGHVKIFLASRPNPLVENLTKVLNLSTIDVKNNNLQDIDKLIANHARKSAEDPSLQYLYRHDGGEDLLTKVIEILSKHAGGMFRWVQMAFEHLHSSYDYWTMQARLESLPRLHKLFDLYDDVYNVALKRLSPSREEELRMALTSVLYPDDFLPFLVPESDKLWVPTSQAEYAPVSYPSMASFTTLATWSVSENKQSRGSFNAKDILVLCPGLLILGGGANTTYRFHFPHFSVREYLLERCPSDYEPAAGHRRLVKACLKPFVENQPHEGAERSSRSSYKLLFTDYAALAWPRCMLSLRAASASWDVAFEDKDLWRLSSAFLLQTPAPRSFLNWKTHVDRMGLAIGFSFLFQGLMIHASSTIFARLLLDLRWEDSDYSLNQLEAVEGPHNQTKWSPLQMAVALRDITAIEWLAARNINMNMELDRDVGVFFTVFALSRTSKINPWYRVDLTDAADHAGFGIGSFRIRYTEAETIHALLYYGAKPHLPLGPGPNDTYLNFGIFNGEWRSGPVVSDLEAALHSECSQESAILLFEDGAKRLEALQDWYLLALWTSVRHNHCFGQWLLQNNKFIDRESVLCSAGIPASKYITRKFWLTGGVDERKAFIEDLAHLTGKIPREFGEDWNLEEEDQSSSASVTGTTPP